MNPLETLAGVALKYNVTVGCLVCGRPYLGRFFGRFCVAQAKELRITFLGIAVIKGKLSWH